MYILLQFKKITGKGGEGDIRERKVLIEELGAGDGREMGSHFRIQWSARLVSEGHLIWAGADKKGHPAVRR